MTRLPGRDLQRARVGLARHRAAVRAGTHHSRSGAGILRGLHSDHPGPGEARPSAAGEGSGTSPWTCAETRRLRPSGKGHRGSTTNATASLFVPVGFGHGFCVLSELADVHYHRLSSSYDPATEAGIAWDDPEIGVEWPISDPRTSERDRTARSWPRSPPSCPGSWSGGRASPPPGRPPPRARRRGSGTRAGTRRGLRRMPTDEPRAVRPDGWFRPGCRDGEPQPPPATRGRRPPRPRCGTRRTSRRRRGRGPSRRGRRTLESGSPSLGCHSNPGATSPAIFAWSPRLIAA